MNWNKYPFFKLVLSFSTGVVLAARTSLRGLEPGFMYSCVLVLLLIGVILHRQVKSYRYRWILGLYFLLLFVSVGYLRGLLCDPRLRMDYYTKVLSGVQQGYYLARVVEPPSETEKTVKIQLALDGFRSQTSKTKVTGRLMAYLQKNEAALQLRYGDRVAFQATVEEVPPPKNPEEFDYRSHLERLGVTGRVYLKEEDWLALDINDGNPVFRFADAFRGRLLDALSRNGLKDEEFGVAAAILLGYDDSLPIQLRQQYVAAGSMHILCVSGMHVGILYLMASFVFGLLGKGKRAMRMRKMMLLPLLWLYALLTGLSPSILRSTLMLSMVIFGDLIHRKGVSLNSIAASAFLILMAHPNDLFSIGFQLSYAAVVGIVVLQRPIYLLLYVKNKLLDKVWEITAVAISAQIATLPFTVFYFHQFTPYFWLSNLFMTPLSFLVIMTGMLLLLVSWVPGLNWLMGRLVWVCLHGMNRGVAWIDSMPCSLVKGLYMNKFEFILSLCLLLLLLLWVALRKKRMVMELLVVACVFSGSLAARSQRSAEQRRLIVYSLRNHTAIDLIQGTTHVLLCDEALLQDASTIDYSLKGAWASMMLDMNPPCYILEESCFWIDRDVLLIRGKQKPEHQLLSRHRPALLLLDASVPAYLAKEWNRQAESMKIDCYNLSEGCFVWKTSL